MLDLPVPTTDLAEEADEWEKRVRPAAEQDAELANTCANWRNASATRASSR